MHEDHLDYANSSKGKPREIGMLCYLCEFHIKNKLIAKGLNFVLK